MSTVDELISKQINRRYWEKLRVRWLDNISTPNPPGTPPESAVSDAVGLRDLSLKLFPQKKTTKDEAVLLMTRDELPEVRTLIFLEATFLLHKARHVLGAAEFNARDGLRTWSLSTAYQSAIYSAKAISSFLGICVIEIENKSVVIDLFPDLVKEAKDYTSTAFYYRGHKFDHKATWELFQRITTFSSVDEEIWPKTAISKLKVVDPKVFSKQRNYLMYNNIAWLENDLSTYDLTEGFGEILFWSKSNRDMDFTRPDISIVLALYMLKLGLALLRDLETLTNKVSGELNILSECLLNKRHPIYSELLKT